MRFFRVAVIVAMVVAGAGRVALAHPPYDGRRIVLEGQVEVVKSFIDGIVFTDPVKIVIRSDGQVRAETPYYRDASIACVAARCLVAASDSIVWIMPQRVYLVESASLQASHSFGIRLLGIVVHLWDHLVGYAFALLFGFVAVMGVQRLFNEPARTTPLAGGMWALSAVGTLILLTAWIYVVALLSELSLAWALIIVTLAVGGGRRVKAMRASRRLHPSAAATT